MRRINHTERLIVDLDVMDKNYTRLVKFRKKPLEEALKSLRDMGVLR